MRNFAFLLLLATLIDAGNGVHLWYEERGKGSPVIVIHGGPGMDHYSLQADLAPLEQHHRVIYYDQRGGGLSTLALDASKLTIDDHVRDLEALRKQLGLEKVTLLAHSFGPAIAAQYAIRHPERVERMIFLSPIPPRRGTFGEEYGKRLRARLSEEQLKRANELSFNTEGDVTAVCREYWSIMTPPRVARSLSAALVKSDLCAAPAAALRFGMTTTNPATFNSLGDWNWTADLAKVKAPVLIIHGEEDAIPMAMVAEWETALPNARLMRLAETAHFPHAERPEVVFPAIEKFLDTRWTPEARWRIVT
ncbi:MAG TPA: alpha/beta hydrolase, partial [Thermoanaerobaculia bacterium]|nr:alpha/beta hydrolase [Thermoanaerobaculia bacterium]